jgi:hypothetical protein
VWAIGHLSARTPKEQRKAAFRMNASQDFTVEGGVLLIYHGNDRTVTVPKGVKRIGRQLPVKNLRVHKNSP